MKIVTLLIGFCVLPAFMLTGCPDDNLGNCEYNGEFYAVDETFPSADGCNGCSCGVDGTVSCTEMACDEIPDDISDLEAEGCLSDDDCRLADVNFRCSVCSGGTIDYASDDFVSVTKDSYEEVYQNWLGQECPDFAACRAADWKPIETCDEFLRCDTVEPVILHPEITAACADGVCVKGEFTSSS